MWINHLMINPEKFFSFPSFGWKKMWFVIQLDEKDWNERKRERETEIGERKKKRPK